MIDPARRVPLRIAAEPAALALLLVGIAVALGHVGDWRAGLGRFQALMLVAFAAYALAVARRVRWRGLPGAGAFVVVTALALRVAVLGTPPTLSDDLYRYAWEGRVLAHGVDPYAHAPADPALAGLRDREIHAHVNHPELRAIYPPLAELGFALVARVRGSLLAYKLWVLLHDLALCALLAWWCAARGTRAEHGSGSAWDALVYAWNPLAVTEYAGSGHFDPTGMLWLVLALALAERRGTGARHGSTPASHGPTHASHGSAAGSAASLFAAVGVKLVALAALPFLARAWSVRVRFACALAIAALLAAYVALARGPGSGLEAFAARWRHNDSMFALVAAGAGDLVARYLVAGAMLALIAWAFHRGVAALDATRLCLRAGLLLSPVLHPWYLGWVLALEPLGPSAAWLTLSCTVLLGYGSFAPPAAGGAYHPSAWIKLIEFGVPLLVASVTRRRRTTRPDRS